MTLTKLHYKITARCTGLPLLSSSVWTSEAKVQHKSLDGLRLNTWKFMTNLKHIIHNNDCSSLESTVWMRAFHSEVNQCEDRRGRFKDKCQWLMGDSTFVVLVTVLGVSTSAARHPAKRKRKKSWSVSDTCVAFNAWLLMRVTPQRFLDTPTVHINLCAVCLYFQATGLLCWYRRSTRPETRNTRLAALCLRQSRWRPQSS